MGQLSFIVFSTEDKTRDELAKKLQDTGLVHVTARISDPRWLDEALRAGSVDGIYVDLGARPSEILELIEAAGKSRSALLVGGPADDARLLLRAVRLGVQEFFPHNDTAGLLPRVLERLSEVSASPPPAAITRRGRALAVVGSKGGVGTTFVACQLAASLQLQGSRTALFDLNLHSGDVALQFDLKPRHTLADLVRKEGEIDATFMRTMTLTHSSGVSVLAAPLGAEEGELVQPRHVETALEQLRREHEFVLLDLARAWDAATLTALDTVERVLLVTSLEVPALTHAREVLRLLPRLGISAQNAHVIVNRTDRVNPVSQRELEAFLRRPADFSIPNDYEAAIDSINKGQPLHQVAAGSRIDAAFRELGRLLQAWCGLNSVEAAVEQTAFVGRLRSQLQRVFNGAR